MSKRSASGVATSRRSARRRPRAGTAACLSAGPREADVHLTGRGRIGADSDAHYFVSRRKCRLLEASGIMLGDNTFVR
jgi:hypothetical protein